MGIVEQNWYESDGTTVRSAKEISILFLVLLFTEMRFLIMIARIFSYLCFKSFLCASHEKH